MRRSPIKTSCKSLPSGSETKLQESISNEDLRVIQRSKRLKPGDDLQTGEFSNFKDEIKCMISKLFEAQQRRLETLEEHIKDVKNQNHEIHSINQDIEKSMSHMTDQFNDLNANLKSLEKENKTMKLEINALNERIEHLERKSVQSTLEIRNVPKTMNETKKQLFDMAFTLVRKLTTEVNKNDIKDVVRSPSRKENKHSALWIEFHSTLTSSEVLSASKAYTKNKNNIRLSASHLGISGFNSPIYISELLPKKMKTIFYYTKNFAKDYSFAHTVSNGRVLLREKDGSPYIIVKNLDQIMELKKTITKQ